MRNSENPFDESLSYLDKAEKSEDKLGELYAARAAARLDEIFKYQEKVEEQYVSSSDRVVRAEERARVEASSPDYEDRLRNHLSRFEDPDAQNIEDLSESSKEMLSEIVKGLSELGIRPLDSGTSDS